MRTATILRVVRHKLRSRRGLISNEIMVLVLFIVAGKNEYPKGDTKVYIL